MALPEASVVIVSYNDQECLFSCLRSVYDNSNGHNLEIIVVDNGSANHAAKEIKERFPGIKLIENSKNLGFSKATNQGIKASGGEYILVLNSDTVLLADALTILISFMDSHQKAAAAGARVLDPQGVAQPTCRRFPTYLSGLFNRTSFLTRTFPNNRFSKRYLLSGWDHENIRRVDWVCGACIILRREALTDVGGLDEDYFMYCEEADWCYRAKKKGWKVYYVPRAKLIHHPENGKYARRKIIHHHRSMLKFYRKCLKEPLIIHALISAAVFIKLAGLLLLYVLGTAFKVISKTLKLFRIPRIIKAWHK